MIWAMSLSLLKRTLRSAGQEARTLRFPDGTRVLTLTHGGRILGLYPADDEQNFLWTHSALSHRESARRFFGSTAWHNSGGDRTWLAPEIDVFLPNFPKLDVYHQPRSLDPGNYRVVSDGTSGAFHFGAELEIPLSRPAAQVWLTLDKRIEPSLDPCRGLSGHDPRLRYAGYRLSTRLTYRRDTGEVSLGVNAWNLLQLPHGGEMLIPTYGRQAPTVFMGRIPQRDLRSHSSLVRWRMHQPGEHKIGLPARACTGRMGYLLPRDRRTWDLVVRQFYLQPSQSYPDAPWFAPDRTGYAVQACSVNSQLGAFSELEYHAPAVTKTGPRSVEDFSDVWSYRGTPAAIRRVADALLGVRL